MNFYNLLDGIKACIFDMDGTLVDSLSIWSDIDDRFFALQGMKTPEGYDKRIAHMNFEEMAIFTKEEYSFPQSVEEIMDTWTKWSKEAYEQTIPTKPYAKEFLLALKEKGYPLALATTNKKELYEPCLKRNGLDHLFSYILNVNEIGSTKREPKIYQMLAEKMGAKESETLVFEDILMAVKTAHNAGFKVASVYDKRNEPDLKEIIQNSDFFIPSYELFYK